MDPCLFLHWIATSFASINIRSTLSYDTWYDHLQWYHQSRDSGYRYENICTLNVTTSNPAVKLSPWNWNLSWWLFIKICFLEYAPPNFTVLNGYAKFLERRNHLDSNSISISRLYWTKKRNFRLNFHWNIIIRVWININAFHSIPNDSNSFHYVPFWNCRMVFNAGL